MMKAYSQCNSGNEYGDGQTHHLQTNNAVSKQEGKEKIDALTSCI
jgi:hypothetical protein